MGINKTFHLSERKKKKETIFLVQASSLRQSPTLSALPELPPRAPIRVRWRHCVALRTMRRPLLVQPRAPLVLAAGHELQVMRPDAGGKPASVVRLVPGRDRPAVVDLPGDVMAAAYLLPDAHDRVAVFVDGALPAPAAGRRLDAVADEFLPEGQRFSWLRKDL